MQIFAYTECTDFQSLLEVECREITGVKPVIHSTVEDLKNMLGLFPVIEVLIVDFPDEFSRIKELKDFLVRNAARIKRAIILGNEHGSSGNMKLFTRSEIPELFEELRGGSHSPAVPKTGWTAIPLCTLIHFKSVPFDLHIRLSDQKFVKRIHAFEEIGQELLEALNLKGVNELFCEKKFNRDFSMMLINNMINKVDRPYDSFIEQLKAHDEVFGTTKEIIQNLGLSGRVIEVCETAIEKMCLDVLNEPDEFSAYLLAMKNDKNLAFHFKMVNLTNYLGTQLIMEMNLPNVDEQVKKFIFASYFCDMTLRNPAYHYHRKAEDSVVLSLEEQNEVNFHALQASELVSSYRDTPKEVSLIIRQHHGSFGGIGFPDEKSNQLLPLSKVLIVSQELAFSILTSADTPILEILRGFLKKHQSPGLSELIRVLEESFREKMNETA